MKFVKYIYIFLLLSYTNHSYSNFITNSFSNSGSIISRTASVIAKKSLSNTGLIEGSESVYIESGNIIGNGTFKGAKIKILAKEFNFIGTIDCSDECTIITEKPVNQESFKRTGKGKFTFKTEPNFELPCMKNIRSNL